jgi:hypothetical protein
MVTGDLRGRGLLEWSVAAKPADGESCAGDRAVVTAFQSQVLVAAVDGLGHGRDAAVAADRAADVLRRFAGESLVALVERCHEALNGTRGAALSLASFFGDDGKMIWLGVGNVEGRLVNAGVSRRRSNNSLLLRSGVVGHQLPRLAPATADVGFGDTLFLATDGIDRTFADSIELTGSAREIAKCVLARHGKSGDDALVVVARYLGGAP